MTTAEIRIEPKAVDLYLTRTDWIRFTLRVPSGVGSEKFDFSGYTGVAEVRDSVDGTVLGAFDVAPSGSTVNDFGIQLTMDTTVSKLLPKKGVWSLLLTDTDGHPRTWMQGAVHVTLNVSKVVVP